jgi:hypothetical protein
MDILNYGFFQNALWGIGLISITAAVIGAYVVCRRMAALAGGVTHACFGGLGLGYFLGWNPLWLAMAFAIGSSLIVERMSSHGRVRSDSAIAVVWAIGMAIGVLFVFMTPGYVPELTTFLFGNILTISTYDLIMEAMYAAILVAVFTIAHRQIVACAFDPDFARVSGLRVSAINLMMTVLVGIGIVLTIRLIGVMLLMSTLALPALAAENLTRRYIPMTLTAVALSLATSYAALLLSTLVDVPCSAFIVLFQAAAYALTLPLRHH